MAPEVVRVDLVLPSGSRAYVDSKLSSHRVAFITDEVSRHLSVHDGVSIRDLVYSDELGGLVPVGPAGSFLTSNGVSSAWGTTLAKSAAHGALTDFLTLHNVNPTDEPVTGSGLMIRTMIRRGSADYDVCSFGGYADGTFGTGANRIGGFLVRCEHNGVLGDTHYIDRHGIVEYHYTGSTINGADEIAAFGIATDVSPGSIYGYETGRQAVHYGGRSVLVNMYKSSSGAAYSFDARQQDSATPTTCRAVSDSQPLVEWKNITLVKNRLLGDGAFEHVDATNVSHPFTDYLPADVYLRIEKQTTNGGAKFTFASDGIADVADFLSLGSECTGPRMYLFNSGKSDGGTGYTAFGSNQTIHQIANAGTPLHTVYGDGDTEVAGRMWAQGYHAADFTVGATNDVAVAKVGGGTRTIHFKDGLYTGYTDS
jgi:hypothetical protein